MADAELVRVLDYILNRCDEGSIEAVAAAVVRRKRDLSLFASAGMPDPRAWAKKVAEEAGAGAGLDTVRKTVRSLAAEMLRKEAPELSDGQIDELLGAWVPDARSSAMESGAAMPPDVLVSMVDQFVAFSSGSMRSEEDASLRKELGAWPERYWSAFPAVVRSIVTEYLAGRLAEAEFRRDVRAAVEISRGKGS